MPRAKIARLPMIDGGEDFTRMMVELTGGTLHPVTVTGPVGQVVEAEIGFLGAESTREVGIDAVFSILKRPRSLEDAIQDTGVLLADAAEQTIRLMLAARL